MPGRNVTFGAGSERKPEQKRSNDRHDAPNTATAFRTHNGSHTKAPRPRAQCKAMPQDCDDLEAPEWRANGSDGGGASVLILRYICFHGTFVWLTTGEMPMDIKASGSTASRRAPADYFTGTVWQDPVVEEPAPGNVRASGVHFEPGARTA